MPLKLSMKLWLNRNYRIFHRLQVLVGRNTSFHWLRCDCENRFWFITSMRSPTVVTWVLIFHPSITRSPATQFPVAFILMRCHHIYFWFNGLALICHFNRYRCVLSSIYRYLRSKNWFPQPRKGKNIWRRCVMMKRFFVILQLAFVY